MQGSTPIQWRRRRHSERCVVGFPLMMLLLVVATLQQDFVSGQQLGQGGPRPGQGGQQQQQQQQQSGFFTRREQCTMAREIVGYNSIDDLNSDIREYYDANGGRQRADGNPTILSLCPGQTFNLQNSGPLRPILNNLFIMCGDSTVNINVNPCRFDGGNIQILIDDRLGSNPTNRGEDVRTLDFYGITFQNFNQGSGSVLATASAPTVATFTNCVWRDFEDADYLLRIGDNANPMTVNIESSTIRSTSGRLGEASAGGGFVNEGGAMFVEGLLADNVQMRSLIATTNNGETFLTSSTVTGSDLNFVAYTEGGGRVTANDVTITNNNFIGTAFLAQLPGSHVIVSESTISNNDISRPWVGLSALEGGEISFLDSQFVFNRNVAFAVACAGEESSVLIEGTDFRSNIDSEDADTTALVFVRLGEITMRLVEIEGNKNFETSILAIAGGSVDYQQVCWNGGNTYDAAVIFRDGSRVSDMTTGNNYMAPGEVSKFCPTPGFRVLLGDEDCVGGSDGAPECLADALLTPAPSPDLTPAPTSVGFLRRVRCPSDTSYLGYVSIEDLNADMEDELERVTEPGAPRSRYTYDLSLCPGIVFEASETPIRPILGDLTIRCGTKFVEPTPSPTAEPYFCDICGDTNLTVINPDAIVPGFSDRVVTCADLEESAASGLIANASCPLISGLAKGPCCIDPSTITMFPTVSPTESNSSVIPNITESPTLSPNITLSPNATSPTASPSNSTATAAPTVPLGSLIPTPPPIDGDVFVCNICGEEGLVVTNPDAIVEIPFAQPATCAQLLQGAAQGLIPELSCSLVSGAAQEPCGCSAAAVSAKMIQTRDSHNNTSLESACVVDGGSIQIEIKDSDKDDYAITDIVFDGIVFQNFEGVSVQAKASNPTVATFKNSVWLLREGLETGQRVVDILSDDDGALDRTLMTVVIESSSIQDGNSSSILSNSGGTLEVVNLMVENVQAESLLFTSDGGDTKFVGSTVTKSHLSSVTETRSGSTEVDGVLVVEMGSLLNGFVVAGDDSSTIVQSTTIVNNNLPSPWNAFHAAFGGELIVDKCTISRNSNLQYGVLTEEVDSVSGVVDTDFVRNFATEDVGESALIRLNGGQTDVLRTKFQYNIGFNAGIYASGGDDEMTEAEITFQQVCWVGNQNSFVVWIGPGSSVDFSGSDNFVSQDETSLACTDKGERILLENTFQCVAGADDSRVCLADQVFTNPPISPPFMGPPVDIPTRSPSGTDPPYLTPPTLRPRPPRPPPTHGTYCEDDDWSNSKKGKGGKGKGYNNYLFGGHSKKYRDNNKKKKNCWKKRRPTVKLEKKTKKGSGVFQYSQDKYNDGAGKGRPVAAYGAYGSSSSSSTSSSGGLASSISSHGFGRKGGDNSSGNGGRTRRTVEVDGDGSIYYDQ